MKKLCFKNKESVKYLVYFILFLLSIFQTAHCTKMTPLFSSFIQTNSEMSVQSTVKTSKKARWTQDGRMCAHAFVQDGETFFDCTKSKSPDGLMNNKEWCYVENPQSGAKSWDYCKAIMDYDQVRAYNENSQREMAVKISDLNRSIVQNIQPAQETLTGLKKLKTGQEELFKKINDMFSFLENIGKSLEKLSKTKNSWDSQNALIKDLQFKIDKLKEKQKEENERETNQKSQSDGLTSKLINHDSILNTKKATTKNCKNMMGYEDEEEGDGLVGKYYDNEMWIGSAKERKDEEINFDWTGSSPMKGINSSNFSIKWEGFLYVPFSTHYKFIIKSDDGAELSVNNEFLLRKNFNNGLDFNENTRDLGSPFPTDPNKIISERIYLSGGTKVRIVLKYFHSIHSSINEDGQILMKLFWESSEFSSVVIPQKYLHSKNDFPPLKVTGYKDAKLSRLYENDFAFKNSDQYIIQDIPSEFIGVASLKYDSLYKNNEINFHINTPSIVYFAFIEHYSNPLPDIFENTGMVLSLLQIDKSNKVNSKKVIAKKSATMLIYKKNFGMGEVKIQLNKNGMNKYGVPFVLFFGFDSGYSTPLTCLGRTKVVSRSSSEYFKKCSSSSYRVGMNCEAAFSGILRDEEGGMWSTNGEGPGAWITVEFNSLFEIRSFSYKNKKNPAERNKVIELEFSNGRKQIVKLKNTDELLLMKIEPVRSRNVKITIKEVYGTLNNGGAFEFYGVKCSRKNNNIVNVPELPEFEGIQVDKNNLSPLFLNDVDQANMITCRESISNSNKFSLAEVGSKFIIFCAEACITTEAPVYGGIETGYTKDSAICRSAYHAGKISSKGGKIVMHLGAPKKNFKGEVRNDIKSQGREWSSRTITFEPFVKEDPIIIKSGTLVDVNTSGALFKKGTIRDVKIEENNKNGIVALTIQIEGEGEINLNYPNEKVKPCGYHFNDRVCKGSIKNFINKEAIKIRFIPRDYATNGDFLPDYGEVYGMNGKPYGFSKDMSKKIRSRGSSKKVELETLVDFPPSPLSKYCNKPNPQTDCEPVLWSVWAGSGQFKVTLFIGDPLRDVVADFEINGKTVAQSLNVEKNKLTTISEVVESRRGFITITSECKDNCELAMSKLNAVEIIPFDSEKEKENNETNPGGEIKLSCGQAFKKGRCDKGPDVLHCIFDDKKQESAYFCSGMNSLVSIPNDYFCRDQVGKYKCVKIEYDNEEECTKFCPKKCRLSKCLY